MDLKRVQIALGEAIEQLEHYILQPLARGEQTDLDTLLKVTYAIAQAAGSYRAITEAGTFEDELADIRKELREATAELERAAGGRPSAASPRLN